MTDPMAERIFKALQDYVELRFTRVMAARGAGLKNWRKTYDLWLAESRVEWDRTLNIMGIKRLERHLKLREPGDDVIRIDDPFILAFKRYLDIPKDTADKILVLGIPN